MCPCAFFSPSLDPILDRGKGDKHPVITPQMPTGGTVGQVIFDHQTHRQLDHPMGIMTAGWGHIGQINVEMPTASGAVMRRVRHQKINGVTRGQIAQVV
jgi:hypothetical protein